MKKHHRSGGIAGKPSEKKALKDFQEIRNPGALRRRTVCDHRLPSEPRLGGEGGTVDVQLLLKIR